MLHIIHLLFFLTFIIAMKVEMNLGSKGLKTQNKFKVCLKKYL